MQSYYSFTAEAERANAPLLSGGRTQNRCPSVNVREWWLFTPVMFTLGIFLVLTTVISVSGNIHYFQREWGPYDETYSHFPESQRLQMLEETRRMFTFGYDNYMKHAFPRDELDPIHCTGRGPDYENP